MNYQFPAQFRDWLCCEPLPQHGPEWHSSSGPMSPSTGRFHTHSLTHSPRDVTVWLSESVKPRETGRYIWQRLPPSLENTDLAIFTCYFDQSLNRAPNIQRQYDREPTFQAPVWLWRLHIPPFKMPQGDRIIALAYLGQHSTLWISPAVFFFPLSGESWWRQQREQRWTNQYMPFTASLWLFPTDSAHLGVSFKTSGPFLSINVPFSNTAIRVY